MNKQAPAFVIESLLVFIFVLGCTVTYTVPSESPSPAFEPISATQTPLPVLPSPTVTLTPSHITGDNVVMAVASKDQGGIFLVESATGQSQKLEISGDTFIDVIGWAANGCTLFVETEQQRIIRVDIKGNIVEEIADLSSLDAEGSKGRIKISPDEQWISLILGTGYHGYTSFQFQNLVTFASWNTEEKFKLTENDGANDVSWNLDSTAVAFTDKDNNNIYQIFASSPNGSNRAQITRLSRTSVVIKSLKWSPTGEKIAFVIRDEEKQEIYLGIVKTVDPDNLIFIPTVGGVNDFFWLSNDRLIADVLPSDMPNTFENRAIVWFDSDTGQELGRLSARNLPGGMFLWLGPLADSDRIGFFSDWNFYTYDVSSLQMEKGFGMFTDIQYWISAPKAVEAESCINSE